VGWVEKVGLRRGVVVGVVNDLVVCFVDGVVKGGGRTSSLSESVTQKSTRTFIAHVVES